MTAQTTLISWVRSIVRCQFHKNHANTKYVSDTFCMYGNQILRDFIESCRKVYLILY